MSHSGATTAEARISRRTKAFASTASRSITSILLRSSISWREMADDLAGGAGAHRRNDGVDQGGDASCRREQSECRGEAEMLPITFAGLLQMRSRLLDHRPLQAVTGARQPDRFRRRQSSEALRARSTFPPRQVDGWPDARYRSYIALHGPHAGRPPRASRGRRSLQRGKGDLRRCAGRTRLTSTRASRRSAMC